MPQVQGVIATVNPYGLKTAHPGVMGLIKLTTGRFLTYRGEEVTVVPGGPRLRVGTACTALQTGQSPYAQNIHLVSPIPGVP